MVANILTEPPPPPLRLRSISQNLTFSGHGHVAYQIKCNPVKIQLFQNMVMLHIKLNVITKYSNMFANILPADPPPPTSLSTHLGMGSLGQIQLFKNMVMLHIKLKEITNAATL